MGRDELRHLEHRDLRLATKYGLEKRVSVDIALVFSVLETVFLNIVPDFLGEFAAGERSGTDNGRKDSIGLNRFEEGGVGFAFGFGCSWHMAWFLGCDAHAVRRGVYVLEVS